MRFAIVGSGAVGGYFGARLARTGQDVSFIARGAHLAAIRERGLAIRSDRLGDFTVTAPAESDAARIGPVDVVIFAVKTYDNGSALPLLAPLIGPDTVVLTLQNGVDSSEQVAGAVGQERVLGGTTYVATSITEPGVIVQTGVHRSIIFGEVFGDTSRISPRAQAIADVMAPADIQVTVVPDGRVPIWDKFVYLAPFAGFTGAARLPIGGIWTYPHVREMFYAASREIAAIAKAEGVTISADRFQTLEEYMTNIPPTTKSSLLVDLDAGKRIEVEALHGAAVRRAAKLGIPVPITATLYALLKAWEDGDPRPVNGR
ncbi:MAG: ketopantoate reductase family protein [Vicinamibacterales bacterium]